MIVINGRNAKGEAVRLVISGGRVRAIYADGLASAMNKIGPTCINRASHVEPWQFGGWSADMGPVGGPILLPTGDLQQGEKPLRGEPGFSTRQAALDAEVTWLRENRGV